MAQDLREMLQFEAQKKANPPLADGHKDRFLSRLEAEFPESQKKRDYFLWYKIAAVIVVALVSGVLFWPTSSQLNQEQLVEGQSVNPGSLPVVPATMLSQSSPEFKKIEDFYLANLHTELAALTITSENKELIDDFMLQLEQLDDEYLRLNEEIKEYGVSEASIGTLIQNLELRLDLLKRLKSKLKSLKQEQQQQLTGISI
ncbi:hypothetical protein ACFSQ0_11635 [Mesonia sediminis]|jgi:hypothetical protein|uniref:Anti-sigma factor n=1 Tax=Mesonia sediminis TaxID=1703946 RepID=A0ABW5SG18_9FLAO